MKRSTTSHPQRDDSGAGLVRSKIMRAVGRKDTGPELIVRRLLHALGYRFRLHKKELPGSPDIVLPRHRMAIFVHGCFWHRHKRCRKATTPKTRVEFWQRKFDRNMERDAANIICLQANGWRVLVIWECEIKDTKKLKVRLELAMKS